MDDLISREVAVKAALAVYHQLQHEQQGCLDIGYNMVYGGAAEIAKAMVQMLMELPRAEAEPVRHGRWEFIKRHGSTRPYHCSCGYASPGRFPYCPCCGAWMDGGETSAAE